MTKEDLLIITIVCFAGVGIFFVFWDPSKSQEVVIIEKDHISDTIQKNTSTGMPSEEMEEYEVIPEPSQQVKEIPAKMTHDVVFVAQAPHAQWENELFQDACEEASVLMAGAWIRNENKKYSKDHATEELEKMFLFEKGEYGQAFDLSAADTAQFFKDYYAIENIEVVYDISADDIVQVLANGHIVIVPSDGQKIGNPYFTAPGPERHMLVITGYDQKKREFITNDPGTRRGEDYRYSYETLIAAVRDYPTGHKVPITQTRTAMIVVKRGIEGE